MNRRKGYVTSLLAALSLVAAACGGDDGDTSTDEPVATTAEPEATQAAAPTTVAAEVEEAPDTTAEEAPDTTVAAEEELTASDVGVTEDTIVIAAAIADLAAVRAAGISIPETLTNEHLIARWTNYADEWNAAGGINGRMVEIVEVSWDPLDQASFDALCAEVTIDNEYFALLNATGLSGIAMECITDAGVPIIYGDVVAQSLLDTGLMVTLAPPVEVVAAAGAAAWIESTDIAPGAKVGVLASNTTTISSAGQAAADALTEAGYEVEVIELNAASQENAAISEEGAAAAGTFLANGAEYAFVATPFTQNGGFWTSAAGQLPYTMLDTAASQCSVFGLSRSPAEASGALCSTAFGHPTNEAGELNTDTAFEAECRAFWDDKFAADMGGPSDPGVPSGQAITDAAGTELFSDYSPFECTIANLVGQALTNAGVNPTRDSFMEAMLNLGEQPFAAGSNGSGTLAPDKPYLANQVHTIRITAAAADTPPDANGLYNGCAAPVNCGVVVSDWAAF